MTKEEKIDGVLFIDANQYLDLYRMAGGKKLLAPLKEQQDHIFVTSQIVDEVQRNKVKMAASFLKEEFKKLEPLRTFSVPDYLFVTTGQEMRDQLQGRKIETASEELKNMARDLLGQISRSEDDVSKALAGIFDNAVKQTGDELQRARVRKELGEAPGWRADPLGDQLSWEQLLSQCKQKSRLWIISVLPARMRRPRPVGADRSVGAGGVPALSAAGPAQSEGLARDRRSVSVAS